MKLTTPRCESCEVCNSVFRISLLFVKVGISEIKKLTSSSSSSSLALSASQKKSHIDVRRVRRIRRVSSDGGSEIRLRWKWGVASAEENKAKPSLEKGKKNL